MSFPRSSGILLHPTCLPGDFGIGDLGPAAFAFIDFLVATKQTYWQILPLGPTGYGDSPYQCFSAFAGNTLLISPEKLVEDGLVSADVIAGKSAFAPDKVDFGGVYAWKNALLRRAYAGFHGKNGADLRGKFEMFCRENAFWLDDYALFRAIKAANGHIPWYKWPKPLRLRDDDALHRTRDELSESIEAEKLYQFLFFRQWFAVKEYANGHGIQIIGDIPIFVALDSADVWCNRDKFKLNADGSAATVAGVPPDYFSKTGQLWGNPIYDWDAMRRDGFGWWVARVRSTLATVDVARIDHFRGFAASWEVPGKDKTAANGRWVDVPGHELFTKLQQYLGTMPFIAEDLGAITPDVLALRDRFGFPGMRILQFGFGGDAKSIDLPHNYVKNCVAYTGTHDNDTVVGWFNSRARTGSTRDAKAIRHEHEFCLKYLPSNGSEIQWDFIRAAWASVADIAIAPLQDIFGLGTGARMNLPASASGNWGWRFCDGAITDAIISRLAKLTEIYGRSV